ncbi:hypothetical protein LJB42_002872 [Komagataella kurtzmanii]|nr:hypothetical protein LJB42_002872 [Komagataella kurtzmanii]
MTVPSIVNSFSDVANDKFRTSLLNSECNDHNHTYAVDGLNNVITKRVSKPNTAEALAKSRKMVGQALYDHISAIDLDACLPEEEESFFVCDLGEVLRLYKNWCEKLPRIKPYYAVKCNNDPKLLEVLATLGTGFDCASTGEINTILNLGVSPDRIAYANPCKSISSVRNAKKVNVNLTTFDNSDELYKIAKYHPESRLLLRISTDDESAQCRLSTKFGASMSESFDLLRLAKKLQLNVAGVAFHVGSGASDFSAITQATKDSSILFEEGTRLGFKMNILDVGGGFVLQTFDESSRYLREACEQYFPEKLFPELKIIAEPGRYFAASAFTLACNVIARRMTTQSSDSTTPTAHAMLYVNDGLYNNLNCVLYDHQLPKGKALTINGRFVYDLQFSLPESEMKIPVSIWGPTCDGLDCISEMTYVSSLMEVGDWIFFDEIGAYTSAAATAFNGFQKESHTIYTCSESLI